MCPSCQPATENIDFMPLPNCQPLETFRLCSLQAARNHAALNQFYLRCDLLAAACCAALRITALLCDSSTGRSAAISRTFSTGT